MSICDRFNYDPDTWFNGRCGHKLMLHNGEDSTQQFLFLLTSSTFLKNNLCYSAQAVFYSLNQITYFITDVLGHQRPHKKKLVYYTLQSCSKADG